MSAKCKERIVPAWQERLQDLYWVRYGQRKSGLEEVAGEARTVAERSHLWEENAIVCGFTDECDDVLWKFFWHIRREEGIEYRFHHTQFSQGGPSDGIMTYCSFADGRLLQILHSVYYFKDWFDAAYYPLNESENGIWHYVLHHTKSFRKIGK